METRQSFTEPSQAQWDEVDRLEHRYFEKYGARIKRPESLTHAQPTMASVGKYIGDLREMLGKDRSSKRHFPPREQEVNRDIERVRRWAYLYQKVHGPCAVLSVPADVMGEIKKLKEELLLKSYSVPEEKDLAKEHTRKREELRTRFLELYGELHEREFAPLSGLPYTVEDYEEDISDLEIKIKQLRHSLIGGYLSTTSDLPSNFKASFEQLGQMSTQRLREKVTLAVEARKRREDKKARLLSHQTFGGSPCPKKALVSDIVQLRNSMGLATGGQFYNFVVTLLESQLVVMRDTLGEIAERARGLKEKPVEHRELCDSFDAKRHYDRMVDEIKFLAELMGGPTFIRDVLGLSGPWETYSPVDNLKRTVSLARYYVKKQKEQLEKGRKGKTSDDAVRDRLINEYRFLKPMSTWYIAKEALERMPLLELIATMDMMREDVKVHMSLGDIPKPGQLSFLAVLDGKTVDITDEFHAWQESVKPSVEELVKAAENVAERSSTDV
jgi:hypothetical protein